MQYDQLILAQRSCEVRGQAWSEIHSPDPTVQHKKAGQARPSIEGHNDHNESKLQREQRAAQPPAFGYLLTKTRPGLVPSYRSICATCTEISIQNYTSLQGAQPMAKAQQCSTMIDGKSAPANEVRDQILLESSTPSSPALPSDCV
ncbi:uncharacterized protein MEPE_01149 [Melanopsichium pennsylvanicum]|uniref:Uncharacterized protein n=1 Tax=Melanopsichium pennsylvanicum TaxID=63383 RepID=A0AAJ4XHY1_9BASI|nr:uncharacterized protein MEPE_01149 [Melanopsichium pennsylvanicum]